MKISNILTKEAKDSFKYLPNYFLSGMWVMFFVIYSPFIEHVGDLAIDMYLERQEQLRQNQ